MPAFEKIDPDKKKNIMEEFVMNEISTVDYGAQEPAVAVLIKRKSMSSEVPQVIEKVALLTTIVDGHQHLLEIDLEVLREGGGTTRWAAEGEDKYEHTHAFVINDDGTITIATDRGHTHTLDASELLQRLKLENTFAELASKEPDTNVDVYVDVHKMLDVDGNTRKFVASDFALVPDINDSNTWRYPVCKRSGRKPDNRLIGNAVNALKRGRVPQTELPSVVRKLRKAWRVANPSKTQSELPMVLKQTFTS